ncbi:MAG: SDR family oxidoreductase [Phycisphaerales bacterium]|nr:MAG: SDR family oxidoreductase [Phycisphaerales bacterium]
MGSLSDKKAMITGASQGIGYAIAEGLIRAGCHVAIHYFRNGEGPQRLKELATSLGQHAECFQADLMDPQAAIACTDQCLLFLGGLDVLVNNTGSLVERRFLADIDLGYWHRVIELNLTTMMTVSRQVLPELEKAGGASIVNLASLAGRKGGHAGSLVYSTTKGAVITWTRSLASEVGPKGIRVNCVAPGLILGTSFHATHTTPASVRETTDSIPLGRAGSPEDVARAVVFLAGEYDGFITGSTLDINGGVYFA